MDIVSLLASAVALLIYPGGIFFVVLLVLVTGGTQGGVAALIRSCRQEPTPYFLCSITAAMVPLPGSPIAILPVHGGLAASLAAPLFLLVAACAARQRAIGRTLLLIALPVALALACVYSLSGGTTVDIVNVSGTPGMVVLRGLCGLCLAAAVLAVARNDDGTLDAVLAAAGWLLAVYIAFSGLGWAQPFIAVVLVLACLRAAALTAAIFSASVQRWVWATALAGAGTFLCAICIAILATPGPM